MIYTPYHARPVKKTSGLGMLAGAAGAFGIGYANSMSKEQKVASRAKIREMLGLPKETPLTQAPAPVADAMPKPVEPLDKTAEALPPPDSVAGPSDEKVNEKYDEAWNADTLKGEQGDSGINDPVDIQQAAVEPSYEDTFGMPD